MIGVLGLQGAVDEHRAAFADLGVATSNVRRPAELDEVDALVIPGGESTTMSMLLERGGLFDPVSARLAAGMPVLGTCAGMILLASEVLDGRPDQRWFGAIDVTVLRNGYGRQIDSFEADLDVRALAGPPVRAVFIRAPVVERAGPDVEVLASVDGRPVLCRQGSVMVSAFHPELTDDRRIHRLFLDTCVGMPVEAPGR
jgi:5'-phosphate synthase pdxT subunit